TRRSRRSGDAAEDLGWDTRVDRQAAELFLAELQQRGEPGRQVDDVHLAVLAELERDPGTHLERGWRGDAGAVARDERRPVVGQRRRSREADDRGGGERAGGLDVGVGGGDVVEDLGDHRQRGTPEVLAVRRRVRYVHDRQEVDAEIEALRDGAVFGFGEPDVGVVFVEVVDVAAVEFAVRPGGVGEVAGDGRVDDRSAVVDVPRVGAHQSALRVSTRRRAVRP